MTVVKVIEACNALTSLIRTLFQLFSTLPFTICTPEKTFSVLRHVMTYLRYTMSEYQLNRYVLMYVHKHRDLDTATTVIDMLSGPLG